MQERMLSTPVYQNIYDIQIQHGKTLFLVQSAQAKDEQALQQKVQNVDLENLFIFHDARTWVKQLQTVISQRLTQVQAGWHALIYGEEHFIWMVDASLRQAGLLREEIVHVLLQGQRKVYCVHCSHMQNSDAENFCQCESCGINLQIRSHFSERLGAYMGVCANAESLGKPYAKKVDVKEVNHV